MSLRAPGISGATRTRHFFPRHRIGWAALVALLLLCLAPAWWAKLDDLLGSSRWGDVGMAAVVGGLVVAAFLLSRQALFRSKDRAIVLGIGFALGMFTVVIGIGLAIAMLGLAVFGD